jgi:hypothetical protein
MSDSRRLPYREPATRVPLERRRSHRGSIEGEPPRPQLVRMIEASYREMPGLSLHLRQAARLFGLREATCRVVLEDLVRKGRLRRSADGQYLAAESGRA